MPSSLHDRKRRRINNGSINPSSQGGSPQVRHNRPPSRASSSTTQTTHTGRFVESDNAPLRTEIRTPLPFTDELDADLDTLSEVIMAVHMADRQTVACAYYVAREEKLYCMEEAKSSGADLIGPLKLYIDPTVIIVSTKSPDEVMNRIDPRPRSALAPPDGDDESSIVLPYLLECRPHAEFRYDTARNKLMSLRLDLRSERGPEFTVPGDVFADFNDPHDNHPRGDHCQTRLLGLSSMINMEAQATVGCCGALISYLQRRRKASFLPEDRAQVDMFRVSHLEMFNLSGHMFINTDALTSLQITFTESHPSAQFQGSGTRNASNGAKEGLSVYGIFHKLAKTQQGRRTLRKYFYRPSVDIAVINDRLDSISVFLRPDNVTALAEITKDLTKVKEMRVFTVNLRKGVGIGANKEHRFVSIWSRIRDFATHALRIYETIQEMPGTDQLVVWQRMEQHFDRRALGLIEKLVEDTVDFDASVEQLRTVVKPGVDHELDDIKHTYDGIESLLTRVADVVVEGVPPDVDAGVSIIFFPQIGFLISIQRASGTGAGVFEGTPDSPWKLMFVTEGMAYYKDLRMEELDMEYGDVYGRICDKEIEIVQEMSGYVLEQGDLLNSVSEICGELDALVALARGAQLCNFVRPQMSEQNVIEIRGGRHPLQEMTVPSFVPNDTRMAVQALPQDDADVNENNPVAPNMLVLTGPNYSGKSVYLKQVAIIVFLAHVGSFVPAEEATIGITDKILTRVSTRESVSRMQSAFMIDLQQVSMALRLATERSLVIIDEFGKGTDSCDGAGLAAGLFERLLSRGPACPKVLAATHFHEIFEAGFLAERPTLGFAHMQVRLDDTASNVDDQITYLYNYVPGRSNSSFGACCAAINGIDQSIVKRAEDLIMLAMRGEDLVATCTALGEEELAELRDAEDIARDFLELDIEQPRKLLDDLITLAGTSVSASEG